ncbi:run domain Beclin-1-interacting and cysteine-rich domain-containing protein isoform X2 [Nematostella vectensis]|uniref:run domain Beclin-1-interacting and cysteine-rich domain-containing protein isoform X2 n=1 Tax=Nematostella vectensis TaxID=45351 RepID=UPI00138FA745|nr:run domain Beclin-1-interacting and cysteine-rich domain-containing protein isoform X2 [Nematostella vectensis]
MATEDDGLIHAAKRCQLLSRVKSTVDGLLANHSTNVWSVYGGLSRLTEDIENILQHGLKNQQSLFGDHTDYTIFIKKIQPDKSPHTIQKSPTDPSDKGRLWIENALLDHCLSIYLQKLVGNKPHLKSCYQDYAFLRSNSHFQALCTCLQAIEKSDPSLLTEVNQTLLDKCQYIEEWLTANEDVNQGAKTELPRKPLGMHESSFLKDNLNIAYSDSGGSEREEFESIATQCKNGKKSDNDSSDTEDELDFSTENNGKDLSSSPQIVNNEFMNIQELKLARERLKLQGFKAVQPKRKISQVTLAQAALSVVLEKEERSPSPSQWFDAEGFLNTKRSTSLNNVHSSENFTGILQSQKSSTLPDTRTKRKSVCQEDLVDGTVCIGEPSSRVLSEFEIKKAIGHNRSKSDQIGLNKMRKIQVESMEELPNERLRSNSDSNSEESVVRLSSSLPSNSVSFYYNDPLYPSQEEQSLATKLASEDLSSCEMDKENAHFSISEALIEAIEQMKCDEIIGSDDDDEYDEDEEIQQLKQEIERRKIEKKQEKLRQQPAFSDDTGTSGQDSLASGPSTTSASSKSSCYPETDDSDAEWEELPRRDEHVPDLAQFSSSETTLVSESDLSNKSGLKVDSIEFSTSPPLSAEAVAKSLLQKFANKKHPAASELQWLVSENDVPQSLLPLPQTYAVAPDDVLSDHEESGKIKQKTSARCRMRGNMEWAPPRQQVIFHVHPSKKRKVLMEQQNYRCAGCGMRVDPDYMKRFRYCNYLGKYFCSSCHQNEPMVIPARIVRRWDFRKYEVSKFAKDLLNNIHYDPLFNIKDLNSALYQRVRALAEVQTLRKQLYFFRTFAQTCRKATELRQDLARIPDHIFTEEHLFSVEDLLQVKSGEMVIL